jgi:ceramide glucosyltransferase
LNFFVVPALLSAGYHAFALLGGIRKLRERTPTLPFTPPVSILKPVRGSDERFAAAIASHAVQNYPEYEILFGISESNDSARAEIEQLMRSRPDRAIRIFVVSPDCSNAAPNAKVGVLEELAAQARFPFLLVNDSDIVVEPDYLASVTAPLRDERIGLVTCLYRGAGGSFATRSEALGIATEFAPSVLVARQAGVREFAMGSTLVFRARDLEQLGGFAAIRDYLADDYQLGKRLTQSGLGVVLGRPVVETWLGAGGWRGVWRHQLRWSRTIRVSNTGGYFGYAITHTVPWCILAAVAGNWAAAGACYAVRVCAGLFIAGFVMRDYRSVKMWWWMPMRDLFGLGVWLAGLSGNRVEWRGRDLTIDGTGRIL